MTGRPTDEKVGRKNERAPRRTGRRGAAGAVGAGPTAGDHMPCFALFAAT